MAEPNTYVYACKRCESRGRLQLCVGETKARAFGEWEAHVREEHGVSL